MAPSRLIAPDLTRGAMLLLIAVANVTTWNRYLEPVPLGQADRAWVWLRAMLVDGRSYTLFSILLGFGIATIAARPAPSNHTPATILRRRGLVMLAFGAVHALIFPGDVLGAYALVTLIFGALVVYTQRGGSLVPLVLVAVGVITIELGSAYLANITPGTATREPFLMPWSNLLDWVMISLLSLPMTGIVPSFVIGVALQRSGVFAHPERRRGLLATGAVIGLLLAAVMGHPWGIAAAGAAATPNANVWWLAGGYFGGLGWLSLFLLLASWVRHPTGPAALCVAAGKRSLSCYLAQSLLFALMVGAIALVGDGHGLSEVAAAAVAATVWLITAVASLALERRGTPGPAEAAMRALVYRDITPAPAPTPPGSPPLPAQQTDHGAS